MPRRYNFHFCAAAASRWQFSFAGWNSKYFSGSICNFRGIRRRHCARAEGKRKGKKGGSSRCRRRRWKKERRVQRYAAAGSKRWKSCCRGGERDRRLGFSPGVPRDTAVWVCVFTYGTSSTSRAGIHICGREGEGEIIAFDFSGRTRRARLTESV